MASNRMGHDPLAWIKAESEPSQTQNSVVKAAEVVVESAPVAPTPEVVTEPVVVTKPAVKEPVEVKVEEQVEEATIVRADTVDTVDTVDIAVTKENNSLNIGKKLLIADVEQCGSNWLKWIAEAERKEVTINLDQLEALDTAGVQLIISLLRELEQRDIVWSWNGKTKLLKSSAAQLGAATLLKLN